MTFYYQSKKQLFFLNKNNYFQIYYHIQINNIDHNFDYYIFIEEDYMVFLDNYLVCYLISLT